MNRDSISWLQIENTTNCNAWCFECGRNQQGYGLKPGLVVEDLPTATLAAILNQFPNLHTVQFCGTYGDFAAAKNAVEQLELVLALPVKIQIHTHGGIRSPDWWKDLAHMLANHQHDVWFALDGLQGTHEIYRQGTDWHKTMANAEAFISAGGSATWQFIPWKHNEHEIRDCLRLSHKKGFKKFKLVNNVRQYEKSKQPYRHWKTGEAIVIEQWSKSPSKNLLLQSNREVNYTLCMHLNQPSVYVNANGQLSTCCYYNLNRAFDSFDLLPDIKSELELNAPQTCQHYCGKPKNT